LTPNELVFTFGGLHLSVQFSENQKEMRVGVSMYGQTDRQTQTDFICPMLYAIQGGSKKVSCRTVIDISMARQ